MIDPTAWDWAGKNTAAKKFNWRKLFAAVASFAFFFVVFVWALVEAGV